MSHQKTSERSFVPLEKPNIDYGGGLERICAAVNSDRDVYNTPFLMRQKEFFQICQAKTMKNIYHPFELFWITVEQQLS